MSEPDFSGIDPLRVPEARRRIAALTEYLALPNPTTADVVRISERIGISRWQFQRLARVWREHRDPKLLVIGRRGPATRSYDIAPRAADITREEIAKAGADAELATVAPEVERRCQAEGVPPLARPTIWNYIREARQAGAASGGPPRIVIGRMWFHLPVTALPDGTPGTDMPTLLVAVALPERVILAWRISFDDRSPPSVADLISDLLSRRSLGAASRALLMEPVDRRAAADVLAANGLAAVRSHSRSLQRQMSSAFGGRLGRLAALYRRALARPQTKRVISRQDERITPDAAEAVIEEAIEASNAAAACDRVPAFDISDQTGDPSA